MKNTIPFHRTKLARNDKFVPKYMRMFDQASHSILSICTCNHKVVIFYDTSSLIIFPHNKGPVHWLSFCATPLPYGHNDIKSSDKKLWGLTHLYPTLIMTNENFCLNLEQIYNLDKFHNTFPQLNPLYLLTI